MTTKLKIPKIRFKEFSGEWEEKKLGETFNIFNGYAFKSSDSIDSGIRWVKIADVGIQSMKEDNLSFLPENYLEKYKKFLLKENDYVVALTRPILNGKLKIAKINKNFNNSLLNQRVGKIIGIENENFIYFLLQKGLIIKDIENSIAGTDPPNLAPTDINNLKYSFPQLPEQQKIASFLSSVDEKIEKIKEKKKSLLEYKKGVMQKIFSQEIRFKSENGEEFGKWEEKKLGEICEIKAGNSKSSYIDENGKNIIVDMGAIGSNYNLIGNKKTNYSDDFLTINDLVMAKDDIGGGNIIGKVVLIMENGKYVLGDHVYKLTLKKGIILYLYYAINSYKINKSFRQKANGTAQVGITNGTVLNQIIPFPTLKEQEKIADFLSGIDEKIEKVSDELGKIEEFKKGLLQGMFV